MPSILRMFTKRGKDTESKSVYGNKDLGASVGVAGTLASSVTLPDEHGVRLHAYSAQAGNLTAASTTSFLNEPGPSGRAQLSMKPSSSTFHPSLFKLAGRNLSSSATNTTAAAASTPANDSDTFPSTIRRQPVPDDPYPTPSTTPSTIGGPSMDKTSKKGRKKRQKNYSTTTHPSFVQSDDSEQQSPDELSISQSSPPDDSHLSMTQRLEQAAKKARLNAARQALEASTSAEGAHQVPTLEKPLPPGPQPEQPESFPTVAQDTSIDSFPAEVSTDPEPTLLDPTILALEEILRHTLLEQDKLVWDTLEAQLLGPTPEPDIPTQPPPYQDTTPPQEDLPSLRLQLDQHKIRVVSLTKEKLEMVQHQHEKISTVLQQLKQSREETHKIVLEQRRYRVLAESLASENDKLKKERREALQDLDRRSKDSQLLDTANKHMKQEISALQSKLKSREAQNEQLNKEKANWQAQINAMQHSLSDSERRVRCLDQVTRQRFEAKQGGYASVGRSAMLHHSPHVKGPSSDIIGVVASFNDEVFQTSTFLVENLDKVDPQEPAFITPEITTRARQIWGLKIVSMLDMQSKDAMAFNFLLLQNCLEVFITHWCMHIIEGLYPPQASFSDVLVELAAQTAGMASGKFAAFF